MRVFRYLGTNSINIGRYVPQVVYYLAAYDLVDEGEIKLGDAGDYAVPTGNFGDIIAGYLAKQMGLPVGRYLCFQQERCSEFLRRDTTIRRESFIAPHRRWISSIK